MSKIYGIDLGTTNSVLCDGITPLTGLVPSIASIDKHKAGESLKGDLSAERSFKINMSLGEEGRMPVAASKLVFEQLKAESGVDVKKVVVSVPAYFTDNQRRATMEAATQAGLEVVDLINEPTAATIYLARNRKGLSVVYDLGGGTFDVSIIDSRFGNYDVIATDGRVVGGDNFDRALLRHFIKGADINILKLSKEDKVALKEEACAAKIRMQKERRDIDIDLTKFGAGVFTLKESIYIEIERMCFSCTISLMRNLFRGQDLDRDNYDIYLVGGSTRCPYLREWISDEFHKDLVPLSYDPDYAVAYGAGLYAEMVNAGDAGIQVSDVVRALSIEMADGMLRNIIPQDSKIPIEEEVVMYNSSASEFLRVNLYQGNSASKASCECIGTLVYDYQVVKDANAGPVIIIVSVESNGTIILTCKEPLKEGVVVELDRLTAK